VVEESNVKEIVKNEKKFDELINKIFSLLEKEVKG
jgi:hypothetical protein